jgi:serine/threonine-protein kinase
MPSRQRVALGVLGHFAQASASTQAALAPDGSSLVFSDSAGDGLRLVRKLRHEGEPTPMAGTEGGVSPFFSPDGRWIGYLTVDGALRKVPVGGGGSITLAENGNLTYVTAAWLDDGTIVFVDDSQRVPGYPPRGSRSGAGRIVRAAAQSPTLAPR